MTVISDLAKAPARCSQPILQGKQLYKSYSRNGGNRSEVGVAAVDGVDITICSGEGVGIVGESGCGKTTLIRLLARLESPTTGRVTCDDVDVTDWGVKELRPIRRRVRMMFQMPDAALNPRLLVADILAEAIRIQEGATDSRLIADRVVELAKTVKLDERHLRRTPPGLSGGEKRRVMLARSIVGNPGVILADEPVSGLDLTMQRELIDLIARIRESKSMAIVVVTHDLSVLADLCDRVVVMNQGRVIEEFPLLYGWNDRAGHHPYTRKLLESSFLFGSGTHPETENEEDRVWNDPAPDHHEPNAPEGCPYVRECELYLEVGKPRACTHEVPSLQTVGGDPEHRVACHASSVDAV